MSYTLYDATVLPAKHSLDSLKNILQKGEASPKASQLPEARLIDDMLPLAFQVHMITNLSQQVVARTSGSEPKSYENNLKTFDDFYKRIAEVQALVDKADKDTINKRDGQNVNIGFGPGKNVDVSVKGYTNGYFLPNLFFHMTTAYNILRKEGVQLGKLDYVRPYIGQYVDLAANGLQ
ncbi:hypothetical protein HIM_01154 [Hirsutella minnesotensis 3608]|nr:hypothetical protein HIM_01154 [Hirsutella minnesotensis 3608]